MNRVHREQGGFTLIELLVSIVILVGGIFGLVAAVDSSRGLGNVAEHEDVASQVADRELDTALAFPYSSLSLSSVPLATGTPANDNDQWRALWQANVPATGQACTTAGTYNQAGSNKETDASCVVSASGAPVAPFSSVTVPTASGGIVKLKIFRVITWVNDLACGSACPNGGPTTTLGDYKRITIGVQVISTATGAAPTRFGEGPAKPVVVSAIKSDPSLQKGNAAGNTSPCVLVTC
jgi:prepilin-type N-terminal cleavage/methylation domain-containing protein